MSARGPPSRASTAESSVAPPSRSPSPLVPPRPSYLKAREKSWNSDVTSASVEPSSASDVDSERESPEASLNNAPNAHSQNIPSPLTSRVHIAPRTRRSTPRQHRPRSLLAASTSTGPHSDTEDTQEQAPQDSPGSRSATLTKTTANEYSDVVPKPRPPPSSFAFPFQSFPGNPDPGLPIPGRRTSFDLSSFPSSNLDRAGSIENLRVARSNSAYLPQRAGSDSNLSQYYVQPLPSLYGGGLQNLGTQNSVYRRSVAGAMTEPNSASAAQQFFSQYGQNAGAVPGGPTSSHGHGQSSTGHEANPAATFRAPFLSPASRPSSSLWAPPSYSHQLMTPGTPGESTTFLPYQGTGSTYPPLKSKAPLPSTLLENKLTKEQKPVAPYSKRRSAYWITVGLWALGIVGAAALCYTGISGTQKLSPSQLCLVFEDNFDEGSINDAYWSREVELGGFGNGEFQMTTNSDTNSYVQNGNLYLFPTLTSDQIGRDAIFSGNKFSLDGCTSTNSSACTAISDGQGSVINPVQSARLSTKGKQNIQFGKIEVKAKMPRGDWLWPAIWMLPENNTYGAWPLSGEIDIVEARGNGIKYPAQGSNYVRSTLNYGPVAQLVRTLFGWFRNKRVGFNEAFHTYGFEWSPKFMRFYVDNRLHAMMNFKTTTKKESFAVRGAFPPTVKNGNTEIVTGNPWQSGGYSAPFDQSFYLIVDLAVGGTSGWFKDGVGNKPWHDGSATPMYDFAYAQDSWYSTWPQSADDRALRLDSVKMWKMC